MLSVECMAETIMTLNSFCYRDCKTLIIVKCVIVRSESGIQKAILCQSTHYPHTNSLCIRTRLRVTTDNNKHFFEGSAAKTL